MRIYPDTMYVYSLYLQFVIIIKIDSKFVIEETIHPRWMDGWMRGWVGGWMDGWMDRLIGGWIDGWMGALGQPLLFRYHC